MCRSGAEEHAFNYWDVLKRSIDASVDYCSHVKLAPLLISGLLGVTL